MTKERASKATAAAEEARADAPQAPSYEAAMKRLGVIVDSLERGDLPLEDALALFEEGIALSRASQQRLDAAQKRIDELLGVDDAGRAQTRPFPTHDDEMP
jgi:exodeoxyribonuclease VII small subunit